MSVNYRLNLFGFLAYPELTKESEHHSSGNYGYLDQQAAMRWVQKNIAAFGGDPDNIAVFGESAGAGAVGVHVRSPLAKGLFQRAIADSGGGANQPTSLADAEKLGDRFAESVGAHPLVDLRKMPASALLKPDSPSSANLDGWGLPTGGAKTYELHQQNDVPLLLGSNADDVAGTLPPITAAQAKEEAKQYGDLAETYLKLFPADSDGQAKKSLYNLTRDRMFWGMKTWACLQATDGKSKAYLYFFTHVPPTPEGAVYANGPASQFGAFHSSELIYVFNNLHLRDWPWTEVDHKLADTVQPATV